MKYDKIKYYRLNEEIKEEILKKIIETIQNNDKIKLAYVFGSFVRRNTFRDIDIAIYAVPQLTFEEFLKLGTEIELKTGIQIDLLQLQDLNPKLKLKILTKGKPLIIKSNELHNRVISQLISEIQDSRL